MTLSELIKKLQREQAIQKEDKEVCFGRDHELEDDEVSIKDIAITAHDDYISLIIIEDE